MPPRLHEISPFSPSNLPNLETVKGDSIEDLKLNELKEDIPIDNSRLSDTLKDILDNNNANLFF
jgi:hypothetical protein